MNLEQAVAGLEQASDVWLVPVEKIQAGPYQPRQWFDPQSLQELAEDIATHGVLQPILLRPHRQREGWFELVAGERRWRAAHQANQMTIRATVRALNDLEALEYALKENLQRESLTDLEEAQGVRRLVEAWERGGVTLSDRALATKLGKTPSYVRNCWNLLQLPEELQALARRQRGIKSSLFAINEVKDKTMRQKYLAMVEAGQSYKAVTRQIEQDARSAALLRVSQQAPEAQTHSRTQAVAKGQSGSMSRGRQLTGGTDTQEARQQVTRHLQELVAWLPHLSDEDYQSVQEFARRVLRGDLAR